MMNHAIRAGWLSLFLMSTVGHVRAEPVPADVEALCPSEQVAGHHGARALVTLADRMLAGKVGGPEMLLSVLSLYRDAALCGEPLAAARLAPFYLGSADPAQRASGLQLYEHAARQGVRDAYVPLANLYYFGNDGVSIDYPRAKELYELAAQFEDGLALNNLGDMYETGRGVTIDYLQARALYERSAAAGESMGFVSLATLLSDGKGVVRQPVLGLAYAEYAAMLDKDSTFIANIRRGLRDAVTKEERTQATGMATAWRKDGAPARLPVPTGAPAPEAAPEAVPAG